MSSHPARRQTNNLKNENVKDASANINYTCHICSLEVPAAFSEEHNASKKHQANASIVAEASERMRALLTANRGVPAGPSGLPAAKYCGVCNRTVENGHEKTAKHKQAVRDDQLLCMLASMYCGEGGHDDAEENKDHDDDSHVDAKAKVEDQGVVDEDGSQEDDAKVDDQTESVSQEETIENENEDDDNSVSDEIVNKVEKSDTGSVGATKRSVQQVKRNEERTRISDEQNASAANFESKLESDGDKEVDKDFKGDDANNDNSDANSREDSHSSNTAQYNKIDVFHTTQPHTVAFKFGQTQTMRADDRNDNIQPNKDTHSVAIGQIDQRAEVTKNNGKDIKRAVNNIETPDELTDKTDQTTKSDANKNQNRVGPAAEVYDPQHDFFWSLVKRFKMEQPWRQRYVNIHPVGNRIQIYIDGEKVNVPYDNFHSFSKEGKKIRCRVCSVYFDKERVDNHTASKQHMNRIMLPVNDSHCYRRITHWSHCIICNEILMTHFEEQHKTLFQHSNTRRDATAPIEIKRSTTIDPYNYTGPYAQNIQSSKAREYIQESPELKRLWPPNNREPYNLRPRAPTQHADQNIQNPKEKECIQGTGEQKCSRPPITDSGFYYTRPRDPYQIESSHSSEEETSDIGEEFEQVNYDIAEAEGEEEPQRRKITLQKQNERVNEQKPKRHLCIFIFGSKPGDTYCLICGRLPV